MLEEVVRPSNAIHLAPFCEELSWHFMQPAVPVRSTIKSTVGAG
jgi:hypothetical protein